MLCAYFRPFVGGAERQAEVLARALLRQGHEVEVLTPRHETAWPEREVAEGLPITRFPLTDLSRRLRLRGLGIPNLWIERRQVQRAVRHALPGFDVLHTHLASPIVAFAIAPAHALGVPVLCKIACGGSDFDFLSLRRVSLLGPRIERSLVGAMDRWVAISSEVRRDLLREGVADARVASIPNGIETAMYAATRARGAARRFLCLGRFAKFDLATLFAAFEELAGEIPDVHLRIAGHGEVRAAEALLARWPRARACTTVVGFSPSAKELDWADVLIHPSIAEGMSNTLLEAMCVKLPCVASDIPPNREVLGEGSAGLLVPPGDSGALRAALRGLALDSGLGEGLAEAGRTRVEAEYAIDRVAARYGELYGEMVAAGPRVRGSA